MSKKEGERNYCVRNVWTYRNKLVESMGRDKWWEVRGGQGIFVASW